MSIRLYHQMEMIPTTEALMSRALFMACQGFDNSEGQPLQVDVRIPTVVAWYSVGVFEVALVTRVGCEKGSS